MPERIAPPEGPGLRAVIEALLFAAEEPLTLEELRQLFPGTEPAAIATALAAVQDDCARADRGLQVEAVAGGFKIATKPEHGDFIRALFSSRHRRRLSAAALETLAIVAYRQPITTPEIHALRGTDPAGVLEGLLEKRLVRVLGRKKVVGKPLLYGTTRQFLAHFGLNSLEDLPSHEEFAMLSPVPPERGASGPFEEDAGGEGEGEEGEYDDEVQDENERNGDGDDS